MIRVAISNLVWRKPRDKQVFGIMRNFGVLNLEISPFRDVTTVSAARKQFNKETSGLLKQYGIHVVAFQALMFRYPEVSLFKDETARSGIFEHLVNVLEFANKIGSTIAVFGSPKNKARGGLSYGEAMKIAKNFFRRIAEQAKTFNITFCIEPTPSIYGADFICDTQEAINFIRSVGHKSLKINLDIGSSILNGEDVEKIINKNIDYIGHVHVSEPHLKAINFNQSFHKNIAKALNDSNYNGFVSVEMLPSNRQDIKNISKTISFVKNMYQ